MPSLRSSLSYTPLELVFGTSGRRGLIRDLTPLEIHINISAEVQYLQSLPPSEGGIRPGDEVFLARDLRPSSLSISEAVQHTLRGCGMKPVNLGTIPTPALAAFALHRGCAGIMVTGSHIPFDRNGYKLNTSRGELLKQHEAPINALVRTVRGHIYAGEFAGSPFAADGTLHTAPARLDPPSPAAATAWVERYASFFGNTALAGKRILVYQHSAVGRDLLVEVLRCLGADAIPVGRSESFVPIDTENIGAHELAEIQRLAGEVGPAWAVVSTDGDSDRPLILAPGTPHGPLRFFSGDLVGMIVAAHIKADAVVVPISCNDAIDRGDLASVLEPKTRIGSPWVIAGMERALAQGKRVVCGWEANGGFLLASNLEHNGRHLSALPTRDAYLPIAAVLSAAAHSHREVAEMFAQLPSRFGSAGLLRDFPRSNSLKIVRDLNPATTEMFPNKAAILSALQVIFTEDRNFSSIASLDYTDGVRIRFANGEVVHIRPSGNADELRIYAVADQPERAAQIVAWGIEEPLGILRGLEASLC